MGERQDATQRSGPWTAGERKLSGLGPRCAKMLPGGIRERLFLLIALTAVPVLALQGWIYYQRHADRRDQALQTESEVAEGVAMTLSAYLDGVHRQLDAVGQTILAFSPYTDEKVRRVLDVAVARHPSMRTMNWVSPAGRILVSNRAEGLGRDLLHRPYFQQIQVGRPWALGDLTEQGAIFDDPTVAMGVGVRDEAGTLLGVVVASIEPTRLGELAFPQGRHAGGMYTIFDSEGRLVYRNPPVPLTWEQRTQWRQKDALLQQAVEGYAAQGTLASPLIGNRCLAARVPIPGTDWVAGAARPVDIAMGPVRKALFQDAILGVIVASLALLLAALAARTIAEPLRRLEHDAQAMGAGAIAMSADPQAPTEVRRLRGTVAAMAGDLIERAAALRESEERYRTLFTNMSEGFALGEAVFHEDDTACDFHFLEINDGFERQTGLTREILGRPMTGVLPNLERRWIDTYCGVARTGEPVRFVDFNQDTGRHFEVYCYRPAPNRFAILFRDVTDRIRSEQAIQEANEQLQQQAEELQSQSEELQVQTEELKSAYETLERGEREYRTLAENTPEVIARFDRRLRHTYINAYGAQVYGVPQKDVIGKTNEDLGMPADKVAFWNERFAQVLATGRQQTVDFDFESPTFGRQYFSSIFVPEFDGHGEVTSILAITRDVTATRRAEQTMRESQERVAGIVNSAMDGIISANEQQRIILFNPAAEKMFGLRADEVLGGPLERLIPHRFRQDHEQHIRDYSQTGETTRKMGALGEVSGLRANGEEFPIEASISQITVAGARVFTVILRDITERKQMEEEMRGNEQRFRTLANAMPQLVWTAEPDGRVDYYNERHQEYRGIERKKDGDFHWAPVLHEDDVARTVEVWEHAVRTGEPYQIEHRVQRGDGSYHWHLSRGMPVRDGEGRIIKWFGTATDIDDVKRAQEALRELTATLESKVAQRTAEVEHRAHQLQELTLELSQAEDRERRRLADVLHDDLQQQLAAVKFHLGLMSSRARGDGALQQSAGQLNQMLTTAIETSRSLSHELSPAVLYHSDMGETFEWLAGQIRTKHGLNVRVHADGEVALESDAVKAFLYKAAQEMLFNVVKHARVGAAGVRVRRRGRYICLSVSDRGRGFDPQVLKATAGFGLFSLRERVQLLGGRMKIRSDRGKGSTFFICVPDSPEPSEISDLKSQISERRPSSVLSPPFSVLRVLVADDHEVVRQGLAALLQEEPDIEVVGEAANGREAVDLASRLKPDVVIMDVAMPLMNGDEATRQTKLHLPRTRVIALSMYAEDAMVEKMRRAGAESYILKTAPAEELLARIRGRRAIA